jgi:O-antigen/teichoic acid export membrane protein
MLHVDSTVAKRPEDRDAIARRIVRNVGIVISGNAAVAAFGVLTLALNARALGAAGLGVLALITTTAALIDRIAAFQTWQPLVKLGAEALGRDDKDRVGQLAIVAIIFDVIAATAAAVVAVLLVLVAGERIGLPSEYIGVAAVYMATMVIRIADAPLGLLRLFDRFALLTTVRIVDAAAQCLTATVLFLLGASLSAYVLSFAAVAVAAHMALLTCGFHVAFANQVSPRLHGLHWSSVAREFWAFSWVMSLSGTIAVLRERLPVLVIGILLGPAAVGTYYVADRVASVLGMATWSGHQALYPEGARLSARDQHEDLRWFVVRVGAIGGAIGFVTVAGAVVLGGTLLDVIATADFSDAYWPLVFLTGGYAIALLGIGTNIGVLVTSGPRKLLTINVLAFVLFAVITGPGIQVLGIAGAAIAHVFYFLAWSAGLASVFAAWLHHRPRKPDRFVQAGGPSHEV